MENGRYYRKWSITYKGKPYLQLYGKKNAHDLLYRLNKYFVGLDVQPYIEELESPRKRKKRSKQHTDSYTEESRG